jgi:hypothetical protein
MGETSSGKNAPSLLGAGGVQRVVLGKLSAWRMSAEGQREYRLTLRKVRGHAAAREMRNEHGDDRGSQA